MLLRCEECAKEARTGEEARGWRTFLFVVVEGKPAEPVDYCPDCAKREFDEDEGWLNLRRVSGRRGQPPPAPDSPP